MKSVILLVFVTLGLALGFACGESNHAAPSTKTPTEATAHVPTGGGAGGRSFSTVFDFANYYQQGIILPVGVPIGVVQAEETADGRLANYGYGLLGGIGGFHVFGNAPPAVKDFDSVVSHGGDFVEVRRSIVRTTVGDALLVEDRPMKYGYLDSFRLLWRQDGRVVQAFAASAGYNGSNPTVGPDTLILIANATRTIPQSDLATAGVLVESAACSIPFCGDVTTVTSVADAVSLLGAPVLVPSMFSFIHVVHAGVLKSYTTDLDASGLQRVFLSPESAAEAGLAEPAAQASSSGNGTDLFERRDTSAGSSSLLFFSAGGKNFMIRDGNAGGAADLGAIAASMRSAANAALPVTTPTTPSATATPGGVTAPATGTPTGASATATATP